MERIAVAREVIGPDAELYVDANGAYGAKQAVRVMDRCADARVTWLEEPVSSNDLDGLRLVREQVSADVAAGGTVTPDRSAPGHGLTFRADAMERYRDR